MSGSHEQPKSEPVPSVKVHTGKQKEERKCSVEGCSRKHKAFGYCDTHYCQFKKYGEIRPLQKREKFKNTICLAEWCSNLAGFKGYCKKHYDQLWRYGKIHQDKPTTCLVDNCNEKVLASGYCSRHYQQIRKHGKIIHFQEQRCSVFGCNMPHNSNGYCTKHYHQVRRHGKVFERTNRDLNDYWFEGRVCYVQTYDKQNNPKCIFIIDHEDYEKIKNYKWKVANRDNTVKNNKIGILSRFLLNVTEFKIEVDHKNHNRLDNRKENLRKCNRSQNEINKGINKNNTSGYKGVYIDKKQKKWISRIFKDNKEYYLGAYSNIKDAAKAYNNAAIKHHGEFAYLNTI